MRPNFSRRTVLSGAAATAAAATQLLPSGGFAQARTQKIRLQLGWLASTNQIGEIAGRHMGYFEEEKIELVVQPGGPSIDGVAMIASGKGDIGQVSSSPSLMLAVSQKIPIQCFTTGLQEHPFTYVSLPKKPILTPKDMIGKKIGIQATSKVLLNALLKKHGIAEKDVEVIPIGADLTPLLTGQVDAVSAWLTSTTALKMLGPEIVTLRLWDAGVKLYAQPMYAARETLEKKPEMVAGFLRAVARGWEYTYKNTDKAVDFALKELPHLKRDDEIHSVKVLMTYAFNAETKAKGWGTFNPAVWQDQITLYDELKQFTAGAPKLEDVITTKILEATKDVRPKIG